MIRRFAATLACAIAAATFAAGPPAAIAATAQQTLQELNSQRAANGIPAGITENPTWSNDCQMHDEYMQMNGNQLTHAEVVGNPGYSAGGAFAGENSVLVQGASWDAGNPYEHAPLHLDQLLAPALGVLGTADADGFSCTTTFPGWTRPAPSALSVYTYPGPGASVYPSEVAREQPFTPGDLVGLKPNAKTGPNLLVFVAARGQSPTDNPATLSQATLSGPAGTVPVVTVDGNTAIPRTDTSGCASRTLSCFIAPGGFIVPVRPLAPGAAYKVHVVVTFAGVPTVHDWSFKTQGLPPDSQLSLTGRELHFESRSSAPVRITFTRANGAHAPARVLRPGHGLRIDLTPGSWQACGVQRAARRYASFQQCLPILVTGIPKLHFEAPRLRGKTLELPIRYTPVLRGRKATLTITPLTVTCKGKRCTTTAGAPTSRSVMLHSDISLPLPSKGHGFQLTLQTAAFQLRDAPWIAAEAAKTFVRR